MPNTSSSSQDQAKKSQTGSFPVSNQLGQNHQDTQSNLVNQSNQGTQNNQDSQGTHQGESQLDQFVTYMKANWKTLLSELVATGVTAYLAHSAKEKTTKN